MVCMPPGTMIGTSDGWTAYAYVNYYLAVYNDGKCKEPSIQMHEIGHNIGLSHSSSKINYGDMSCYMGASPSIIDGPRMCFNGQKSWKIGWYLESSVVVDGRNVQYNSFSLVGVADYSQRQWWQSVVVKIINSNDGFDYYLSFNRQSGINSETQNGGDQVLVIKHMAGSFYGDSILAARLNSTQMYSIFNFDGVSSLEIWPNMYFNTSPPYANVMLFKNFAQCKSDQDCNDSNSCTSDSCVLIGDGSNGYGYCVFSEVDCSTCGAMVTVEITTNDYPKDFNRNILNVETGQVIHSSMYYNQPNFKDSASRCIEYGKYNLIISYPESKNLTTGINFTLHVGDELIEYGTMFEMEEQETMFIICSSNEECKDYNGCTYDYCDLEKNLCNNTQIECIDCTMMSISILPDNYQEETVSNLIAIT